MLPTWCDAYSVQNALIDEQHKKLFDIAAIADKMISKQTDPVEIKKVLVALFDYMKTHFHDEEAYMESIGYPKLDIHKAYHQEIIIEMVSLIKNIKYDFKQKLAIITEQWLLKHIMQEDMKVMNYRIEMESKIPTATENSENNILEESTVTDIAFFYKNELIKEPKKLHIYTCRCGKTYNIESKIHQQILNGRKIGCKRCHAHIIYINDL